MDELIQDLRQAFRMFRDHPVLAVTAIAALALGISVNAAIFAIVNAVLLKPLPYPEPGRLVALLQSVNGVPTAIFASPAHFSHWRELTDVFSDVVAWRTASLDYSMDGAPASATAGAVSDGYFRALGATFVAGRALLADENAQGGSNAVVLSHAFWTQRLGARPDALGSIIALNGVPHTVVGITSDTFDVHGIDVRGFGVPDVWVPLRVDPNRTDFAVTLDVFARLRDGVSLEAAQQRLAVSIADYRERYPEDPESDWQFAALGLQEAVVRETRPMLLVLTGAVALVLLIACVNVANLLLVRAADRGREIAIRATLGAGRTRIVRQLLTESVVLTVAGGVAGLWAGVVGLRWLFASGLIDLPRIGTSSLSLDWRVSAFTLALSVATGLVFGLAPALVGARADLSSVMKDSTTHAAGGRRRTRTQSLLVVVQVALAVVLVIGAGLLIRTTLAISAVDLGVTIDNVLTLRSASAEQGDRSAATVERGLERLRTLPGVEAAAASIGMLLENNLGGPFDIVGRDNAGPFTGSAAVVPISADYFATLGIELLEGRAFDNRDGRGAPGVAIINRAMADLYWESGLDPLADRIRIGGTVIPEAADEPDRQIIGIVANVRQQGIVAAPEPTLYFPHTQMSAGLGRIAVLPTGWIVRTNVDPQSVAATVQQVLREETGQAVTDVRPLASRWEESVSRQRLNLVLMSIFGGAALLLGALGVYGLVAYSVRQRRHEIGIRLAVGARPGAVRNMVVREGMLRVLFGLMVGVFAGYFLANALAAILFGVEPHDPVVFATVPVVLGAVGLAAVYVPALRATRIDPTLPLRSN